MCAEVLEHLLHLEGVTPPRLQSARGAALVATEHYALVVQEVEQLRSWYVALIEETAVRAIDERVPARDEGFRRDPTAIEDLQVVRERWMVEREVDCGRRARQIARRTRVPPAESERHGATLIVCVA